MTDFNPLNEFSWLTNSLIPLVDPADLRSAFELQKETGESIAKRSPNLTHQGFSISIDCYKQTCSPGANVGAVWYRLSVLWMLQMMSEAGGPTLPGLTDGKPDDAVFKALATLPMTGLPPAGREGLPFDGDELIRLIKKIKKESEA